MVMDNVDDFYEDLLPATAQTSSIPDTYSSLQRGSTRQPRGSGDFYNPSDFVYGTYRPHNHHRQRNKHEYNNFATSFGDEFDLYR